MPASRGGGPCAPAGPGAAARRAVAGGHRLLLHGDPLHPAGRRGGDRLRSTAVRGRAVGAAARRARRSAARSEEHTSDLQSLMRISYAVFCLKNKTLLLPIL